MAPNWFQAMLFITLCIAVASVIGVATFFWVTETRNRNRNRNKHSDLREASTNEDLVHDDASKNPYKPYSSDLTGHLERRSSPSTRTTVLLALFLGGLVGLALILVVASLFTSSVTIQTRPVVVPPPPTNAIPAEN